VLTPSWAVHVTVTVLAPSFKAIEPDAVPDFTPPPSTVTVAFTSLVVGVTVMEATLLATWAV
jgi:hypothetical protein